MYEPTASNPLNFCGAVVATCIRNALKRQTQNLCQAAEITPKEKERNLIQCHIAAAAS
jgi:hypothetical protein